MHFLLYIFFTYESWKEIEGYSGQYLISNRGRVKRKNSKKMIGSGIRSGYYSVTLLGTRSKKTQIHVHRLVATYFVQKRGSKFKYVNHKDGNKLNNDYENLEWCTPIENSRHHFWNWKISGK